MLKHSAPQPLKAAIDIVKRFSMDLGPKMTPEQRRDFTRLQSLLEEADRVMSTQNAIAGLRLAPVGAGRGY